MFGLKWFLMPKRSNSVYHQLLTQQRRGEKSPQRYLEAKRDALK